ncbi:unnamed protein product [Tilletia controversa]|uniref:Uracil-DNA glycosylase n=3 Tax=Tilletia TaxID=13289 RepID=A0A8X7MWL2_9BASI|nr:hypothetical protein CF336_g3647 [Tilletia laevis]KAE8203101.1 hypothetical protein CF328_g1834 [Tilletia controversa]KAE8261738.1 hypothetical protein A4X03_0g3008 [Tilletia caries]KAE8252206.1 hypothetical protein A4X06_0g2355 [Tilletia controversa]CAD6886834.1 unnamed protein product [Tilletia caries]
MASTPSTRPKRVASSSPTKSAAPSVAKKAKLDPSPKKTNGSNTDPPVKDDDIEDEFDDGDALDNELLMEVAEQAEREAARKLAQKGAAKAKTSASSTAAVSAQKPASDSRSAPARATTAAAATSSVAASSAGTANAASKDSDDEVHTMEAEWRGRLQDELKKEYYVKLKQFLASERKAGKAIYPPTHLVHNWSRLTPLSRVKVVVVGQDPYHGAGQACGHSFSVPKGIAVPGSLKNIYKELQNEYTDFVPPKHGCLDEWAKQGVLLLNACLTVYAGQAGSHSGKGWEPFTRVILKTIADEAAKGSGGSGGAEKRVEKSAANPFGWSTVGTSKSIAAAGGKTSEEKAPEASAVPKTAASKNDGDGDGAGCKGVVFLVWGQPAAKTVAAAGITEKSPNVLILRSPHPSPLSAHRGFLGNGHFKKANEWLETIYGPGGGIDWSRL